MIKYISLSTLFLILFSFGNAQEKQVDLGFNGGPSFNSSHGSSLTNNQTGTLMGYTVGGHVRFGITKHLGIKAILQYEQNGWSYRSMTFENSSGTGLVNSDLDYKLNYLNLPLLAHYEFGQGVKFNGSGGVFIGALLKNQLITKIEDQPAVKSSSKGLRTFNYGLSFGIGTQIPISSKVKVSLDLRDNLGLADLNKSPNSSRSTLKTNSLSITSRLTFSL